MQLEETMTKNQDLLIIAIQAAQKASVEILKIYSAPFDVEWKQDNSPLTAADRASHQVISEILKQTEIPVLSEEGQFDSFEKRGSWKNFWLVDPLDGTKEFVRRNGEFTINIALMENNKPLLGLIHIPVKDVLYATDGTSFYKIEQTATRLFQSSLDLEAYALIPSNEQRSKEVVRVLASRSHMSPETAAYVKNLEKEYDRVELLSAGSALKFCLLAEGRADVYPRFAPTMEWDTAAGHALLKAVGKNILLVNSGQEMTYNKHSLVNDWFIAK